jgi:hypothetical protein
LGEISPLVKLLASKGEGGSLLDNKKYEDNNKIDHNRKLLKSIGRKIES